MTFLSDLSKSLTVASALVAAGMSGAGAAVLYEVPPPADINTPALSSGGTLAGFDDFSLDAAGTVTSVSWHGRFSGPGDVFRIGFYDHIPVTVDFGLPAATPFFEVDVVAAETVEIPLFSVSSFEASLGAGVSLDADTIYWLSIYSVDGPFFGWQGYGGGVSVVRTPSGDTFNQLTQFFTLEGEIASDATALDGPPGFGLMAAGLGFLAAMRRGSRGRR